MKHRDVIERNSEIDELIAQADFPRALRLLERGRVGNRRLILIVAGSLALDVALTIALAFVGLQARQATTTAAQNANNLRAACLAGNDYRAADYKRWTGIVKLSQQSPQRPMSAAERESQRRTTATFLNQIRRDDAPRDCSHIGKEPRR